MEEEVLNVWTGTTRCVGWTATAAGGWMKVA